MKSLHRTKALAAYDGARTILKSEQTYPSYMMFKESVRGILSYIVEDSFDKEISDKTKLEKLLSWSDTLLDQEDIDNIQKIIDAEHNGLQGILTMDVNDLKSIKKTNKHLIATWLKEPV